MWQKRNIYNCKKLFNGAVCRDVNECECDKCLTRECENESERVANQSSED